MKKIIILILIVFCASLIGPPPMAKAKAESKNIYSLKDGCENIGTIGTVIVARCYDEKTDMFLYGNSIGWMSGPIQ